MLADSLSLLCKTGDGLAHAYVRLDIHEKYAQALCNSVIKNCAFARLEKFYKLVMYIVDDHSGLCDLYKCKLMCIL